MAKMVSRNEDWNEDEAEPSPVEGEATLLVSLVNSASFKKVIVNFWL
jgi:hypothetical protein